MEIYTSWNFIVQLHNVTFVEKTGTLKLAHTSQKYWTQRIFLKSNNFKLFNMIDLMTNTAKINTQSFEHIPKNTNKDTAVWVWILLKILICKFPLTK